MDTLCCICNNDIGGYSPHFDDRKWCTNCFLAYCEFYFKTIDSMSNKFILKTMGFDASGKIKIGLKKAQAAGRKLGRPRIYGEELIARVKTLKSVGGSHRGIAKELNMSKGSVQHILNKDRKDLRRAEKLEPKTELSKIDISSITEKVKKELMKDLKEQNEPLSQTTPLISDRDPTKKDMKAIRILRQEGVKYREIAKALNLADHRVVSALLSLGMGGADYLKVGLI